MPHEDFFESKLIEFTIWENGKEKRLAQYKKFEDIPKSISKRLTEDNPIILFKDKKWKILEINKDLRAHGKGMHVKVRLEKYD